MIDHRQGPSTSRGKTGAAPSMLWVWRTLLVAASEEVRRLALSSFTLLITSTVHVSILQSIILFACASPDEFYPVVQFGDAGSDSEIQSLVVAYELRLSADAQVAEAELEHAGQWVLDASTNSIGLRASEDGTCRLNRRQLPRAHPSERSSDTLLRQRGWTSHLSFSQGERSTPDPTSRTTGVPFVYPFAPTEPIQSSEIGRAHV